MKTIQKIITAVALISILFFNVIPVSADDIPQAPAVPSAPSAPVAPTVPSSPSNPNQSQSPNPSSPSDTTSQANNTTNANQNSTAPTDSSSDSSTSPTPTVSPNPTTTVTTGNASAQDSSTTKGDNNLATQSPSNGNATSSDPSNGSSSINAGNGSSSTNASTSTTTNTSSAIQTNTGSSTQTLTQGSTTGKNNASENVGDTNLTTGDANVSGTIITAQNTNVDGIAVAEFNVNDNHTGDLILDYGSNCISGCSTTVPGEVVKNIGNGANSNNNASSSDTSQNNLTQTNNSSTGNNLMLSADSGDNLANRNTAGTTTVQTGDANVSANSLTFLNNNISGNVVYGVVNIYGDLEGDIILPQSVLDNFNPCPNGCSQTTTSGNVGNGTGSTNTTQADQNATDTLSQTNDAVIANDLSLSSTTGANDATRNTGGTTTVTTGQASATSHVLNIANSNISGGNYWLVLVNQAGQWIGKILGSPDGSSMASNGLTLTTDSDGNVIATNDDNGAGSTNATSQSTTSQNTTTQSNTASVGNNLTLSANTGGNTVNENTGGNVDVTTGNAKILANIVNFVNNNIVGNGKLFVTIVNVFGKWVGDFVGPGQTKAQNNADTSSSSQSNTNSNTQPIAQISSPNTQNNIDTSTPNPIVEQTTGTTTQQVLGTVSTVVGNSPTIVKSAMTGIQNSFANHKVIKLNLAWLLIVMLPLGLLLASLRLLRRKPQQ